MDIVDVGSTTAVCSISVGREWPPSRRRT